MPEQAYRRFMERYQRRMANRQPPKHDAWMDEPVLGREQEVGILGLPLPRTEPDLADIVLDLLASADEPPLGGEAQALAHAGRGGDNAIGHLTPGEIVVPQRLQTPEVMAALARASGGAPLQRMQVGHPANRINPRTGAPEFDDDDNDASYPSQDPSTGDDGASTGRYAQTPGDTALAVASERIDPTPIEEIDVRAPSLPRGAPYLAYPQAGNDPTRPDYLYKYPDGSTETLSGGTATWRMNNPGNLRYGDYGNALRDGAIGARSDGNAIFPDPEVGLKAFDKLINNSAFNGPLTIDKFVEKYAGRDNPQLSSYQNMIRQYVGAPGDTLRSDLTAQQQEALRNGLLKFENTTAGTRRAEFPDKAAP